MIGGPIVKRKDVEFFRGQALALMVDRCVVRRKTGEQVTDDEGRVVDETVQVYPNPEWPVGHPWVAGPCQVQTYEAQETAADVAGADITTQRYKLKVPVGAGPFRVDDLVTVTATEYDPLLVGRTQRVTGLFNKSIASAQRLQVEVVS